MKRERGILSRYADTDQLQERLWRLQRAGWVVLLAFVVAGFLGLFGPGPLNRSTLRTADGKLEITYDRFGRLETPQSMHLRFAPSSEGTVWISRDLLEALSIESMFPQPEQVRFDANGMTLSFASPAGATSPAPVELKLRPGGPGLVRASIGANPEDAMSFWQFVYP